MPRSPYGVDVRSMFSQVDYFVDVASGLVLRLADSTHLAVPPSNFSHTIDFDKYKSVHGALVPTHVSEKFMGTEVWVLQLTDLKFDVGLVDSHFALE